MTHRPLWRGQPLDALLFDLDGTLLDTAGDINDETRAAYLDVPIAQSADGVWPAAAAPAAYDAYSPATPPISVWKGFQRNHAEGLELLALPAASASGH